MEIFFFTDSLFLVYTKVYKSRCTLIQKTRFLCCLHRVYCVRVGVSDMGIGHPVLPLPLWLLVTVTWIMLMLLLLMLEQLSVVRVIMAVVGHVRRAIGVVVGGSLLEVDILCWRVTHSIWVMLLLLH